MLWIGQCRCKPEFGGRDGGERNCSAKQNKNLKFLELIQEGIWERGEIRGIDEKRCGKME